MSIVQTNSHFQDTKLWDLAAATPLIILCASAAGGFVIMIHREWSPPVHLSGGLLIASQITSAVLVLLQGLLLCVRGIPISKAKGVAPRLCAIAAANGSYVLLAIPRALPSPTEAIISSVLIVTGTAGSVLTLMWLRKAFAIFPQARELVTDGPYKVVRHPLYVAEQISAFGLAMQFRQPWGLLIVSAAFVLQFPRMGYEENILERAFPIYHEYANRTARIIPFLY